MMRLIVSRSTKRTDALANQADPAGTDAVRRDRYEVRSGHPAPRTSSIISNRPGILVLGTLAVVALSSSLILSNADVSRRPGEISLHPGENASKFKDVKGSGLEAHMRSILQKTEAEGAKIAQAIIHPKVPRLTHEDLNRRNLQEDRDRLQLVDFRSDMLFRRPVENPYDLLTIPRAEHPGVGPMIRDWKTVSTFALLAGAIMHGSVAAALLQDPPTDSEKLDAIQKQLKKLDKNFEDMARETIKNTADLGQVKNDLKSNLERMGKDVLEIGLSQAATRKSLDDMREDVNRLKSDMEALRSRVQANSTRALYLNPNETSIGTSSTGKVEMVNSYANDVAFVVNRRTYYLKPGERRETDPIPAGTFTYEVLGIQAPLVRNVGPNQIFTVTVYNR